MRSDGNCLYRACSKRIIGKDDIWSALRTLTSIELLLHKDFYAHHPYVLEKSRYFKSENTAFSVTASDKALSVGYDRRNPSSRVNVVEQEAYLNCKPQTFSLLLCIFGLCSVLGKNIQTVYPEEEGTPNIYSQTNNGVIRPRKYHNLCKDIKFSQDDIIIMWTGSGQATIESKFDHFVTLIPSASSKDPPQAQKRKLDIKDFFQRSTSTNGSGKSPNILLRQFISIRRAPRGGEGGVLPCPNF